MYRYDSFRVCDHCFALTRSVANSSPKLGCTNFLVATKLAVFDYEVRESNFWRVFLTIQDSHRKLVEFKTIETLRAL